MNCYAASVLETGSLYSTFSAPSILRGVSRKRKGFLQLFVLGALQDAGNLVSFALGADHAFVPAQPLKIIPAVLVIAKLVNQTAEVNCFSP